MSGAVVVEELVREPAACRGDHARAARIPIDKECDLVSVRAESIEDELAACQHLIVIVGGDVSAEQLRFARLIHGPPHRIHNERDCFLDWGEHLIALRFVILDEVPAQPELVGGLRKGLGPKAQLRLDDRAGNIATVLDRVDRGSATGP